MTITPIRLYVVGENSHSKAVLDRPVQDLLTGSGYLADGTDFAGFGSNAASPLFNTALGYHTLWTSTGTYNAAFGHLALAANTTGLRNTAIGAESLAVNTTGNDNTAIGWQALYACTTGYANCAIGDQALLALTTGYTNTAVGITSMVRLTTGNNNTACGVDTLQYITASSNHTAVGSNALGFGDGGDSCTAVGWRALTLGGGTVANTAVGLSALQALAAGTMNTAMGTQALYSNTGGSYNTAVGMDALLGCLGSNCVALGAFAGAYETGSDALYIDNQNRASTAGDKAGALLYGIFNATPANQRLRINANVGIGGPATTTSRLNITGLPTSSAGLASGDVWKNGSVLTIV